MATIGIEDEAKFIRIGEKTYLLKIWDTAGQKKFTFLPQSFYQSADGILFLFDVTCKYSFDEIPKRIETIKENLNGRVNTINKKNPIIYWIGNKIDSNNRIIRKEEV